MIDDVESSIAPQPESSDYFVVEIAQGHYAICQKTLALTFGASDPARGIFEGYLDRSTLRAAVMPGTSKGGGHNGPPLGPPNFFSAETGRHNVVITINNSGCKSSES